MIKRYWVCPDGYGATSEDEEKTWQDGTYCHHEDVEKLEEKYSNSVEIIDNLVKAYEPFCQDEHDLAVLDPAIEFLKSIKEAR